MKIYTKRGNTNYKEKKYIKALEKVFAEKIAKNSNFENEFQPAATYEELQNMYSQYCTESVEFEEINTNSATTTQPNEEEERDTVIDSDEDLDKIPDNDISNPMNEAEPIIRDYVSDGNSFKETETDKTQKTTFEEPQSFGESFKMPEDNLNANSQAAQSNSSAQNNNSNTKKEAKQQPINPDFDSMKAAKKKKSTQRMAKYIVNGVCDLSERGFVWYANKNIDEEALIGYQLKDEIDLDVLLSLEQLKIFLIHFV